MISSENSSGLVTDAIDRTRISCRSSRLTAPRIDSSAVQFSTITIVASAISPIAIARPASENRLIVWLKPTSGSAVNSVLSSRIAIGPIGGPDVAQKQQRHDDQHDQLDAQRLEELPQRRPDPGRAIVGGDDLDALPAATRRSCCELLLERARDRQDVLVLLHDRDAADDFAGAVEIDGAAALVVADLQVADVLQRDRRAVAAAADDERLELVEVVAVDHAAQLVVAVGDLDHPAAGFLEDALHGGDHLLQRDAGLGQQRREDLHLVLLLEPADRGDLRDAGHRLQRRLDLALVHQPQLAQIVQPSLIDQRVLIDPAHAAGVGAERDAGVRRQLRPDGVDPIEHQLLHALAIGAVAARIT